MAVNSVVIVGRLTKDIELKRSQNDVPYAKFTVAVDKPYNKDNDHPEANWIDCKAWRQHAEFIAKYFSKGSKIGITGSLQTSTYESDGKKIKTTEVVVSEASFIENKGSGQQNNSSNNEEVKPKEMEVISAPNDDDVPF
jgi:single-strand DNA-binding protein